MTNHRNSLTDPELERLAILAEEAAEVAQISMKVVRHGYESYHPDDVTAKTNRALLASEIADLKVAIELMEKNGDIHMTDCHLQESRRRKMKYTYYQEGQNYV